MKKKQVNEEEQELEILKAVAQAWYGHSGNIKPTNEFDAHRSNYKSKPTRFKMEAMNKSSKEVVGSNWDFGQSLWDSYEIVTVSKKLEEGLVMDHPMSGFKSSNRIGKISREKKNSLRNLFYRTSSSKRFNVNILERDDL